MNKERRKSIAAIIAKLEALQTEAESIVADIEAVAEGEEEYRDNMPESLQAGEKGEKANAACDALDEAKSAFDEIGASIESAIEHLNTASE